MSNYPATRAASPQAWRRLWKAQGPGETKAFASDIAKIIRVEAGSEGIDNIDLEAAIEFALNGYNWLEKGQE